jgi:hypothetical protein
MKKVLMLCAASEALTGVIILVDPSFAVRLLFGSEINGAGAIVGRFAGVSLIGLGVACWPGRDTFRAFLGMLTYSTLVALLLAYAGVSGMAGVLLWPAVAVHVGMSVLLASVRRLSIRNSAAV